MSKQDKLELCAKCRKPDLCERRGECMDRAAAAPAQWSDVASDGGLDPRNAPPVSEPVLPVAEAFSLTRSIYTADDMRGYARTAVAADRAARVPTALVQAMLNNNGGPIDAESTVDGKDYVMVLRADFDALASATQWSKP